MLWWCWWQPFQWGSYLHRQSPDDSSTNAGLIFGCPLSFSRGCHGSSSVHTGADVHCRVLPAKFLCQRKSSLTHLWQTRYDSVHSRPNRAPIQLHATGSPFLTQSHLTVHPLTQAQEGWRLSTSHLPVWAKPDVSFCYIKIKLTDKKANVLADKREAYSEDALSRVWSFLEFAPVNARRIFKPRSKWLWGIVVDNKGKQGFDVKVGSLLSTCGNPSKMQWNQHKVSSQSSLTLQKFWQHPGLKIKVCGYSLDRN